MSLNVRNSQNFLTAPRLHRALTAGCERRVLTWMGERAPAWVTADRLTGLGLAAQMGAGLAYAWARSQRHALWLAAGCIVLNWLGDSLDGTVARVRRQQRPRYGFYVDHMVDLFGSLALMLGLACSGLLHPAIAIAMLLGFLLLAAESYLATYTLGRFELSQGPFGPTEIRILLVVGTLRVLHSQYSTVFGHRLLLFDVGGAIAATCMLLTAVLVSARHTAQLYRQEPLQRWERVESREPPENEPPLLRTEPLP